MATGHVALLSLVLWACLISSQASVPSHAHASGLREAAARRGSDLARAPDGSIATDAPLPTLHAHTGVRASSSSSSSSSLVDASDPTATATPSVSLWLLLAMTMVMALLSGVGAMPYLFTGKLDPYWSGIANAVGCGVMLAASFDLLEESKAYSASLVLGGILLGVLAMAYSQAWLSRFEDVSFSDLQGADARKAMLIIGVMAAHAFGEGSGVGVSFSGPRGWAQGLLVTIAIGLHNIPEGMAVATIMVARGTPPRTALFWTLLSALPQGIVAVPSYMFVETFTSLLPIALGFAAGCMIWIVFAELIPDALETAEHGHVATAATLSAAALQCISMVISKLERPDGSIASPIQADLGTLLPDLALLTPAFLAPAAAAGLAGGLLPSLPLSMGVSVGVGAWTGLAGLLGCLMRHRLDKHAALLWAGAGAAACAAVWRGLVATVLGPAATRKDSGAGATEEEGLSLVVKAEAGGPEGHRQHQGAPFAPPGPPHYPQSLPVGNGWAAASTGGNKPFGGGDLTAPLPYNHLNHQPQDAYIAGSFTSGVGGSTGGMSLNGGVATAHVMGVSAGRGSSGQGLERRNGYGPGVLPGQPLHHGGPPGADGEGIPGGGSGGGLWSQAAQPGLMQCHGNCSCKECDSKPQPSGSSWGAPMDLLPGLDRPRDCVRASLLLGLMLLAGSLPTAYEAAGALLGHLGDTSSLLPPLVLRGIALGAACVGVARAAAGRPGWRPPALLACLLGLTTALTVGLLLAPLPVGRVRAEELAFDAADMAERLRAFASGGTLLAAVGYMWPAAAHFKPRRVQLGVGVGLGLGAAAALAGAGLCAGTPYCLTAAAGN